MTHSYTITGMTCGKCVARVKNEILKLGDVVEAEVQLNEPQAQITMGRHIPVQSLQQAIGKAGPYTITEMNQHAHLSQKEETMPSSTNSYFPIFLIFGLIAGITFLIQVVKNSFSWMEWMNHFMAGFFFVFSFFKLLDLKGFAEGYGTYDVLARKFPQWGYIYPFVELLLGIALLTGLFPIGTNIAIIIVMGIASIGVIKSVLKKSVIQCACLGTVIKLPLGKVTLVEDLLMVAMSLVMLLFMA